MNMPKPPLPEGFQKPGVPGAGNALDPAVRAELRALVQEAVTDAMRQLAAGFGMAIPDQPGPPVVPGPSGPSAPPDGASTAAPNHHRHGKYPHGDVDLSHVTANVPEETSAQRSARGRSFYFLSSERGATPAPAARAPAHEDTGHGHKPG